MNKTLWKRSMSMLLALILVLAAVPVTALAAESEFTLVELKGTDIILDETALQYTGEEIRPNVTVRVDGKLLTLDQDYTLKYADNIEVGTGKVIVTGIETASETVGYTGTVEIPFEITAKAPAFTLIELKGTDVVIDGTEFTYTGSPIEPKVTVTVEGKELTAGKDYSVAYTNNVEVGTATVTVAGNATASETVGYTGTVEIDFTIKAAAPVTLKDSDVTLEGTEFTYTGSYIEPKVTVTVGDKVLTQGTDYTLSYRNNIGAGTATAIVTGIEAAGYTGQAVVNFTILRDPELPEFKLVTLTDANVTISAREFVYTGKAIEPKITVTVDGKALVLGADYSLIYRDNINVGTGTAVITGIATASETIGYTGTVEVEFEIVTAEETPEEAEYKITKGDKSTWYQESGKSLSFTANGDFEKFAGVRIDGKTLSEKYYTVKEGTVVTLKNSFLKKLDLGKHTITIEFEDGEAEGAFKVAEGLDTSNPETGDASNITLWISVMGISAAAGAAMLVFRRKYFS